MTAVLEAPVDARDRVAQLAAAMTEDVDALGRELAAHVRAQVPELGDDVEMCEATDANGVAHVGAMAALLRFGVADDGIVASGEALGFARMVVHRGVSLPTLLRCYHVGQVKLWHQLADRLFSDIDDPDVLRDVVRWSADFVAAYLDAVREQAVMAYSEEHDRWSRSNTAIRERAIRRILSGDLADPQVAGRELRHDLQRHHLALHLAAEPPDPAGLEAAVAGVAAQLGAGRPLTLNSMTGALWAWVSAHDPIDPAALRAIPVPAGVMLAAGSAGYGLPGFRASHDRALRAARVSRLTGGRVTCYEDVAFLDALTADDAAARAFAASELRALSDASPELRATLLAFLETGASHKRAALALGVHEKTVVGRVRRAESLLGRPLSGRRAAVEAALRIHDTLS